MKKLCIYLSVFLFALLTVQAQENEQHSPRIFGFEIGYYSSVKTLDVSGCPALEYLDCSNNELTILDVSGCTSLKELRDVWVDTLRIYGESMDALTIRRERKDSKNYKIGVLDASGCTTLRKIRCTSYGSYDNMGHYSGGTIERLNLQGCKALDSLYCYMNNLKILDVSGCTSLTYLSCGENHLSLDVSTNTALTYLDCSNEIIRLGAGGAYDRLGSNSLQSSGVSACTSLKYLNCELNYLESLDVSGCKALEYLNCNGNRLGSLDVSGCMALKRLYCGNLYRSGYRFYKFGSNHLNRLDVSSCTALEDLDCSDNQLSSLNVSGCTALTALNCSNTLIIEEMGVFGGLAGTNSLQVLDVSACTALASLDCAYNDLTSLDVSKNTALEGLNCDGNNLTSLDVSKNTALIALFCGNVYYKYPDTLVGSNHLSSLDVSGCTALASLDCAYNDLASLDVSKNTALEDLYCDHNQLTGLDVSKKTALGYLDCSYNRIPLSDLYETYSGSANGIDDYYIKGQSDSIVLLVGEAFDLSSERRIGDDFSTYKIKDRLGNVLPANLWQEQGFVFRFNEPYNYRLEIQNSSVSTDNIADDYFNSDYDDVEDVTFTWYITVLESLEDYLTVQVAPNNTAWGTVSVTGNGRFTKGETATVTATPNAGYRFVNWTEKDGTVFATEAAHTFTVTEDVALTANFEKLPDAGNGGMEADNLYVYVKDHTIYLSSERGMVRVYNAAGVCVYSGRGTAIPVHSGGLYIVRVGERAYKAVVR